MVTCHVTCTLPDVSFNRRRREPRANARADWHRRDEAHPVHTVVDRHAQTMKGHRVADEGTQKRQRQEAVRDRGLERRFGRRAHGVGVDPLAVAGRLGELIDARLGDLEPVADRDFLADAIAQRRRTSVMSIMSPRRLRYKTRGLRRRASRAAGPAPSSRRIALGTRAHARALSASPRCRRSTIGPPRWRGKPKP